MIAEAVATAENLHDDSIATRIQAFRAAARHAVEQMPTIQRVVLYGSLVTPNSTLHADAVMLVEIESSKLTDPRDRVSSVLKVMRPLPGALEMFVLTSKEVGRFSAEGSPLLHTILRDGLNLLGRG